MTDPLASTTRPSAKELASEFTRCTPYASGLDSISDIDDVRFCRWPGQRPDGKKKGTKDHPAFPWEGASDAQPLLADGIVTERASLLATAFWRSIVKPKVADDEAGTYAVTLADHFIHERLFDRMWSEVAMAANHIEHYGAVILHPCWEQQVALRRVRVRTEQVVAFVAQKSQEEAADLMGAINDPTRIDEAVEKLSGIYEAYARASANDLSDLTLPSVKPAAIRRLVKALREDGQGDLPLPYVCRNEPAVYALRLWDEVFLPVDTTEIESARFIFQRVWFTEADLRAKEAEGWDKQWIEKAAAQKGKVTKMSTTGDASVRVASTSLMREGMLSGADTTNLIEVVYAYHRAVDDDGVPGVYLTVFQPGVLGDNNGTPDHGYHELLSYNHGSYPFVGGKREHWCRQFLATRGVPETVRTWQHQVKALDDSVVDWTSMGVLPPINIPKTPLGTKYRFGPATQNEVLPGREPQFMDVPTAGVSWALRARESIDTRVANHFALMSPDVPPARWQNSQAMAVTGFLLMWSRAIQQMVALVQQHMADAEFSRITGAPPGWLDQRRTNLGLLGVELSFDVRELDPELTTARLKAINETVLPIDVGGRVDRNKLVEVMLRSIAPGLAKELLVPQGAASQKMFDEVRNDIAQMFLGNEARYTENDPAAAAKLQYVQQIVGSNPKYQQGMQTDPQFAELMQKYLRNLQFSVTQAQNRQVGRIGVQPGR